jgi:hypothetical protein
MNMENRSLVINELVEFEKQPVEVQNSREMTYNLRGICGTYLKLSKKIEQSQHLMNRLNLKTL